MLDTIKVEILKKVATQVYTTVSEVVKELNLTWGAAQWHLFWLENNGYVKSANVGGTTIYVLNCANVLRKLESLSPTEPRSSGRRRASSASTRQ
ncbi:MAG: helix-turn-helix transcriptional regulator [Pyrobaculum sp.]